MRPFWAEGSVWDVTHRNHVWRPIQTGASWPGHLAPGRPPCGPVSPTPHAEVSLTTPFRSHEYPREKLELRQHFRDCASGLFPTCARETPVGTGHPRPSFQDPDFPMTS